MRNVLHFVSRFQSNSCLNLRYCLSRRFSQRTLNIPTFCPYDTLEVSKSSSLKDIKRSFKKMTKIYHPDVYKGPNSEKYKQVLEAYEILRNPVKRNEFDAKRSPGTNEEPKTRDSEGNFDADSSMNDVCN